jgi:hypothetical protein
VYEMFAKGYHGCKNQLITKVKKDWEIYSCE